MTAVQCGICRNVMSSASFITHKERKHSLLSHVPYKKMPDDTIYNAQASGDLVKCRFCPNRIPSDAMEKHMKRFHIECHLCHKIYTKSNFEKHMTKNHTLNDSTDVSQSSSSLTEESMEQQQMEPQSSHNDPPLVPYQPPPPELFDLTSPPRSKGEIIRVNEWQLHNYIRQGRVYTKNGCLYLRHTF